MAVDSNIFRMNFTVRLLDGCPRVQRDPEGPLCWETGVMSVRIRISNTRTLKHGALGHRSAQA